MAPRLHTAVADAIDDLLALDPNTDLHALAALYSTTYKTVVCRRRNLLRRLKTGIDPRKRPGPVPKVTPEIKDYVGWLVQWDPSLYLAEISNHIFAEFEVKLHVSQVHRLLKDPEIAQKKAYAANK